MKSFLGANLNNEKTNIDEIEPRSSKRYKYNENEEFGTFVLNNSNNANFNHGYTSFNNNQAARTSMNYEIRESSNQRNYYRNDFRFNQHRNYSNFSQILNRHRKWEYTNYGKTVKLDSKIHRLKLASYNLLAPGLVDEHKYLYYKNNQTFLDWNYRKQKILQELEYYDADIYCFQEMQEDQYNDYFLPKFIGMGYESIYKKRTGDKVDGCCICFKKHKFKLVRKELIDYYVPNVSVLNRENVGIVLLLESTDKRYSTKQICVATTHILFNPKRGDCKLAQLMLFLASIDKVAFKELGLNQKKHIYHPTIVCGDFNLDFRSKLYEFMRTSKFSNFKSYNRCLMSGQLETTGTEIFIEDEFLPEELGISDKSQYKLENEKRCLKKPDIFGGNNLSHPFNFDTVYKHYNETINDFEITTCVDETKKTVDFIFFHSESKSNNEKLERTDLNLIAYLELFHQREACDLRLPNKRYPSDHFMIAAKFALN